MLNKIIHYSLHNRLVVVCAAILLLIAGTYTAMHTEVDVFPDLNAPTVVIMTRPTVWLRKRLNSSSLFLLKLP